MKLFLIRGMSTDQGTPGVLVHEGGSKLAYTLELPWHENRRRISCIPTGTYRVRIVHAPKHGDVYMIQNVPDRDSILIHTGNTAGDTSKGYESDVLGCIIVGARRGFRRGQIAVLNSRPAFSNFMRAMRGQPFELEVTSLWTSVRS